MSRTVDETLNKIYELALGNSPTGYLESLGKGQLRKRMQQIKACIRSYRNEPEPPQEKIMDEPNEAEKIPNVRYLSVVKEDPETHDLILELPKTMCAKLGWHPGDTLVWTVTDGGSVIISKA